MKKLMLVACLGLAACGGGSSTAPDNVPSLNGNYQGSASDNYCGPGTLRLTLSQSGSSVTGTYTSSYPACGAGGGSVAGTVNNGQTVSATLQPSVPNLCPYQLTGSIANGGATITGTYAAYNCTVSISGTFAVNR